MKLILSVSLSLAGFLYSPLGYSLDLSKQQSDLFYECKVVTGGGLYKIPETGDLIGTLFNPPPEAFEWRLTPLHKDDLESVSDDCLKALIDEAPKNSFVVPKNLSRAPQAFCLTINTQDNKDAKFKISQGCVFTKPSIDSGRYHALACGRSASVFFDTDRLKGVMAMNNFLFSELSEIKTAGAYYVSCDRLDR